MALADEALLTRRRANFAALTPLSLLARTAEVHPERVAVRHAGRSTSYRAFADRCRRLGAALVRFGIARGEIVSIIAPNTPAHLDAHFGVAMAGAVLHSINIRLDAATIAYMLEHAGSRLLIVDDEFAPVARAALALMARPIPAIHVADPAVPADPVGFAEYEDFIAPPCGDFVAIEPADEWDAISLNYTSGTTDKPKGVVYHHRGAYLNAIGNTLAWGMRDAPVYLWTLPLFHCNGWCFAWTITALGGTHVCLRRPDAEAVIAAIVGEGVTHLCCAPIVLSMLAAVAPERRAALPAGIAAMTAGAPPPAAVLQTIEAMGIAVTHTYGLTETYGPCVICEDQPEWAMLDPAARAAMKARQGVRYQVQGGLDVRREPDFAPVPHDGETLGEVVLRGNLVMKGYLNDPAATDTAFAGGWFRTGDLGVVHPDGYVELKDRAKDIVISGGENISSIEIESALFRHPDVLEAAVVARPDPRWGEVPCAFVALKPGGTVDEAALIAFVRGHLAGFKVPKRVIFGALPKTATGKVRKYDLRRLAREDAAYTTPA